jgi:hypothetical protein
MKEGKTKKTDIRTSASDAVTAAAETNTALN